MGEKGCIEKSLPKYDDARFTRIINRTNQNPKKKTKPSKSIFVMFYFSPLLFQILGTSIAKPIFRILLIYLLYRLS